MTTVIDGAQAVAHLPVNVAELDCDFFVFSGHKIFGPTGIGVMYGKKNILEQMPPYQGGGAMIFNVNHDESTYAPLPAKFEAGTPPIAEAIALKKAINAIEELGFNEIERIENNLLEAAKKSLSSIKGLKIIGSPIKQCSVLSFTMEGIHPHDIGTICNQEGVAVRTGHHCTQLIMKKYKLAATTRASFSVYNTLDDVVRLEKALLKTQEILK